MKFNYVLEVLNNELHLVKQDYYSFAEKKNIDRCMMRQIELEQAIKLIEEVKK